MDNDDIITLKLKAREIEVPDFILEATNVYRIPKYIVCQSISFEEDEYGNEYSYSNDTFYVRTKERDEQYDKWFGYRRNKDGKRFSMNAYSRTYVA